MISDGILISLENIIQGIFIVAPFFAFTTCYCLRQFLSG